MKNKLSWRKVAGCLNKKTYWTIFEAEEDANSVTAQFGVKMKHYKCPYCKKFHLTKIRERV